MGTRDGALNHRQTIDESWVGDAWLNSFHEFYDASPDAACICDPQGCFMDANPGFCSLTGYSRGELLSKSIQDIGFPEAEWAILRANMVSKSSLAFKTTCRHKDLPFIEVECRAMKLTFWKEGLFLFLVRSVSEHKRTEESLLKRTDEFEQRAKEINCLFSISRIIENDNLALEDIIKSVVHLIPVALQYPKIACARAILDEQEFKTTNWAETEWRQVCFLTLYGEQIGSIEVCYLQKSVGTHEEPFLQEEVNLINDIAERLSGVIKRRWTEEKLRRSEEKYRSLYSTMSEGVAVHKILYNESGDPIDYVIVEINSAFEVIFGMKRDDILGKKGSEVYGSGVPPYLKTFAKVVSSGKPTSVDTYYPPKEKYFTISAFSPEKGKFATVFSDTTRYIQAEQELVRSRVRIIEAQESLRKEIAQQIHGTIQNRLMVLLIKMKTLAKSLPRSSATELNSMWEMLENLLETIVRPISHRLYPAILQWGLIPGVQSLGDQLATVLNVDIEIDSQLKKQEVDNQALIPEKIRLVAYRVVEESLINCTKHAQCNKVIIRLDLLDDKQLRLTIQDDGCGFNVDQVSKGLGIANMRDIAQVVGGRCTINSAKGQGSEVTAILPLTEDGSGHRDGALP